MKIYTDFYHNGIFLLFFLRHQNSPLIWSIFSLVFCNIPVVIDLSMFQIFLPVLFFSYGISIFATSCVGTSESTISSLVILLWELGIYSTRLQRLGVIGIS